MPTAHQVGAADRVAQRLDEREGRFAELQPQRRAALGVHLRATSNGSAAELRCHVVAKFSELVLADHVLEDVEAVPPVSVQDVVGERIAFLETDWAAVAQRPGTTDAALHVVGHGSRVFGGGGWSGCLGGFRQGCFARFGLHRTTLDHSSESRACQLRVSVIT